MRVIIRVKQCNNFCECLVVIMNSVVGNGKHLRNIKNTLSLSGPSFFIFTFLNIFFFILG